MRSTILAVSFWAVSSIHASEFEEWVHQSNFGDHPTKTTPITLMTEDGPVENYGQVTELCENKIHRTLQTAQTGAGFGNDPTACQADGVRFTCVAPNVFSAGENTTQVTNTITCDLNDQITMDFQASQNCVCNAHLEQPVVNTTQTRVRDCACGVCPKGSKQAVSLNCSNVVEDPYIVGQCVTIDCDGRCNGGASVVNAPTTAPAAASPSPASAAVTHSTTFMTLTSINVGALLLALAWIMV